MAITNAQQYQQLVNPPMKGKKRPGYRGDAAARSTGAAQSGRADPGSRGDPGEGRASKGSGVSKETGGFAPTKGVSANVGPTGRDDLVRKSLLNQAKKFRTQQKEKSKGLNLLERFRINRLKKLFERKNLPQFKYAPVGIELLQSLSPTQLSVYESTSEDDIMDTGYGMTGEDLTDSDRLADAINKAEDTGVISQSEFEDAFFGPKGKPTVDDRDGPQDPCRGPNPPAYCFTGIRSAAPVVEEEEPEYVNPLSLLSPRIAGSQFAAEGGRIGLRGGDAARSDAASGRNAGRADPGGGVERGGGGEGPKGPPTNIGGGGSGVTTVKSKKDIFTPNTDFMKFNTKQLVELGLLNPEDIEDENTQVAEAINFSKLGVAKDKFTPDFGGITSATQNLGKSYKGTTKGDFVNALESGAFKSGGKQMFDRNVGDLFEGVNLGKSMSPFDVSPTFQGTTDKSFRGNIDIDKGALEKEAVDALPKGFFIGADGGRAGLAGGGIASLEDMDREGFLLGGIAKGLKKAVRGVKKLAKSPIGKAALGFAAFKYGKGLGGLFEYAKANPFKTIGGVSLLAGLMTPKEDEDKFDIDSYYASSQLDPSQSIRGMGSEFDFYGGQRIASAEGGATEKKEPVAKKVMPLIDMDGKEKDYRETGGFVDMGRMEKADDVPARLSKNEFVFTADAVRNAGDGSVDKGSEVMYNMMKNLESGGDVSEESQGLDGARKMFQTSQRLEEVL